MINVVTDEVNIFEYPNLLVTFLTQIMGALGAMLSLPVIMHFSFFAVIDSNKISMCGD